MPNTNPLSAQDNSGSGSMSALLPNQLTSTRQDVVEVGSVEQQRLCSASGGTARSGSGSLKQQSPTRLDQVGVEVQGAPSEDVGLRDWDHDSYELSTSDVAQWSRPDTRSRRSPAAGAEQKRGRKTVVNVIDDADAPSPRVAERMHSPPNLRHDSSSPLIQTEIVESGTFKGPDGTATPQLVRAQTTQSLTTAVNSQVAKYNSVDEYARKLGSRAMGTLQFMHMVSSQNDSVHQASTVLPNAREQVPLLPDSVPITHPAVTPVENPNTHSRSAVMRKYYGPGGESAEAQRLVEEEAAKAPPGCKQMPLGGNIRDTGKTNPIYLHAGILFIPFLFFIITFCIIIKETATPHNFIPAAKVTNYLSDVLTFLSVEQARAAQLNALANTRDLYVGEQQKEFFHKWRDAQLRYTASQEPVNSAIGLAASVISKSDKQLTKMLKGMSPWNFLDVTELSETRVFCMVSNDNADIMLRYDTLMRQVLLYNGALSLINFFSVEADIRDIQSVFASDMNSIVNSLIVYLQMKDKEAPNRDEIALPSSLQDVQFIATVIASLRTSETTLRFPSDHMGTVDYMKSSGLGESALSFINTVDHLYDVILPPIIQEKLMEMLVSTYNPLQYADFNITRAEEYYGDVVEISSATKALGESEYGTLLRSKTSSEKVRTACIIVVFCLCVCGLIYHIMAVIQYRNNMELHERINTYAHQLRGSVQRMHNAATKMINMRVDQMDFEQRLSRRPKLRTITAEEREFYIGTSMLRQLEPYLPLPMRKPPAEAPAEALVHGLFIKPCLTTKKDLVAIRLDFSSIIVKAEVEEKTMQVTQGSVRFELERAGSTNPLGEMGSAHNTINSLRGNDKRPSAARESTMRINYVLKILQRACNSVNAHMPQSKTGAFLEQHGESATIWINLCEDVPTPSLIAFSVCTSLEWHCEQKNMDCPRMVICCADAIVGNIPSFDPNAPAPTSMETYHAMWSKSAFFTEEDPTANALLNQQVNGAANTTTLEVKNSMVGDLVVSTEGMSKSARAAYWFKQLLHGAHDGKDDDEPAVVDKDVVDQTVLTTSDAMTANDDEALLTLPSRVDEMYAPDAAAANLTSFIVYGDISKEMSALQSSLHFHRQSILANDRSVKFIIEEKRTFDTTFDTGAQNMFRAVNSEMGHSYSQSQSNMLRGENSWEGIDLEEEDGDGAEGQRVTNYSSDNMAESSGHLGSMLGSASAVAAQHSDSMGDSVVTNVLGAVATARRLRRIEPQCIPIDSVEYSRRLVPVADGTKKKSKRKGQDDHIVDIQQEFPPYVQNPNAPPLSFVDYGKVVTVKAPAYARLQSGEKCTCHEECVVRPIYTIKWDSVPQDQLVSVLDAGRLQTSDMVLRRYTEEESSDHVQLLAAWSRVYCLYAQFAHATTALEPTSQVLAREEIAQLHALTLQVREAVIAFRLRYPTNHLGLICGARMLDVAGVVQSCLESGPMHEQFRFRNPFSLEVLEILRFHEDTTF